MEQIGPTTDFKRQVLQWGDATVHMKEPRNLLGQSDLTKRKMREVVMQTVEPYFVQESTEQMVKILNITYVKADLKQVVNNASHLNSEERTLLLSLIKDFGELFDGNLGNWPLSLLT